MFALRGPQRCTSFLWGGGAQPIWQAGMSCDWPFFVETRLRDEKPPDGQADDLAPLASEGLAQRDTAPEQLESVVHDLSCT